MRRFFVDTSAWIAIIAASDPHHQSVAAEWRRLLSAGVRPVTTCDVTDETITFLRYRAGHTTAVDFRRLMEEEVKHGHLDLVWTDANLFALAWKVFLKYDDQDLSMTDCTSIACCRREKIEQALTLDRHFRVAGLAVLPET